MKPLIMLTFLVPQFTASLITAASDRLPKGVDVRVTPAEKLPGEINAFEPSVAADHRGRVVVAAIDIRLHPTEPRRLANRILTWTSADGGQTFAAPHPVLVDDADRTDNDPWLQPTPDGRFLLAHLATSPNANAQDKKLMPRVVLQGSSDGGRTWGWPTDLSPPLTDKPVLAVSPKGRCLAVIYSGSGYETLHLVRSSNGGATWHHATGSPESNKGIITPTGLVIDDAGLVMAGYTVRGEPARALVATTADGGASWAVTDLGIIDSTRQPRDDESGAGVETLLSGVGLASGGRTCHAVYATRGSVGHRPGIWYRSSADGRTWSDPIELSRNPAALVHANAIIAAAGGRVHVAWLERQASRCRIWYRGSDDGGTSWSDRVEVSKPRRPSDLLTDEGFLYFSGHYMGMAEDGAGETHVVWGICRPPQIAAGEVWHAKLRIHRR